MPGNTVTKILSGSGNFTVPAGATFVEVYGVQAPAIAGLAQNPGSAGIGAGIKYNGAIFMWGDNGAGAVGDGTITDRSSPVAVIGGHSFIQCAPGGNAVAFALKANGQIWAWGNNTNGVLGTNSDPSVTAAISSPIQISGGGSFIQVSGSSAPNGIALKADGTAWAWGANSLGGVGDGTNLNRSSPVAVVGGHLFTAISGGGNSVGALKSDGSAWAWGSSQNGQLGDGTTTPKSSPVAVIGGHSFIAISGSTGNNYYALKSDGSAWAWGGGTNGQIGDGTAVPKSSPVAVIGGHSFIAIQGNGASVLALKADGTAWAWGSNSSGQLGDGTVTKTSSPIAVIGGHSFVAIGASGSTAQAIKADGSIWAWGTNQSGRSGIGVAPPSASSSPVAVVGPQNFGGPLNASFIAKMAVIPGQVLPYNTVVNGASSNAQFGQAVSSVAVASFLVIYQL